MSLNVETFSTVQQFLALETFGDEASTGSDFARCGIVDPMVRSRSFCGTPADRVGLSGLMKDGF